MDLISIVTARLSTHGYLTSIRESAFLTAISRCLKPLNQLFKYSVAYFLLAIVSQAVNAYEFLSEEFSFIAEEQPQFLSWLPGEQYDPRTGRMGHSIVDMEVKGNRLLPIVIKRTHGSGYQGHFGNMSLDLPRIRTVESRGSLTAGCAGNSPSQHVRNNIVFRYGDLSITFVHKDHRSTDAPPLPSDADFISTSNWIIKCSGRSFVVMSPNGMSYELGSADVGTYTTGDTTFDRRRVTWNITRMTDPYGNYLSYHYGHGSDREFSYSNIELYGMTVPKKVTSIIASDGREVRFDYQRLSDTFQTDGQTKLVFSRVKSITSKTSDGSPPQSVSYNYNVNYIDNGNSYRNNKLKTVLYGGNRNLSYVYTGHCIELVAYPEGGAVIYNYDSYAIYRSICSAAIQKRTTTNSGVVVGQWTFYWKKIPSSGRDYATIITDPYKSIEYRYRPFSTRAGTLNTSDGKLLMIKKFGRKVAAGDWYENASANTVVEYEYQKLYNMLNTGTEGRATVRREIRSESTTIYEGSESPTRVFFKRIYDWQRDQTYHKYYRLKRLIETSSIFSRTTEYTYWNLPFNHSRWINGKVGSVTTSGEDKIQYDYNTYGDAVLESNNGVNTHYRYHRAGGSADMGELATTRNEDGFTQSYQFYKRGIPSYSIDPMGRIKNRATYDNGTLRWETPWGTADEKWVYTYDSAQRLKSVSYPGGTRRPTTITWPDPRTKIETTTGEGAGISTTTKFDGFGQIIFTGTNDTVQIPGPRTSYWRSKEYAYDSLGRLIFESHPSKHSPGLAGNRTYFPGTDYEYDPLDRLKKERTRIDSSGAGAWQTRQWEYFTDNGIHLGIRHINSLNQTSSSLYQDYGRPGYKNRVSHTDAGGIKTIFQRDPAGRLLQTTRSWQERKYRYNAKKQLMSETHPENGYTGYLYNNNGLIERAFNQDQQILYRYYPDDQLRQQEFVDSSGLNLLRIFEYDRYGNLASQKNRSPDDLQNNDLSYSYDAEGRVLSERMVVDGRHYTLDYTYDTRGNLSSRKFPNGRRYEYAPNGFGEPTKITGTDGKVIYSGITYHAGGPFFGVTRNDYRFVQTVDLDSRSRDRRSSSVGATRTLAHHVYNYDTESNLVDFGNRIAGTSQSLTYDRLHRLRTVDGDQSWSFDYNANDDITQMRQGNQIMSYGYDSNNSSRLLKITSSHPERLFNYDGRGNVVRADIPVGGSAGSQVVRRTMTRNAANQLVAIDNGSRYAYDARGLRVSKDRNGKIYTFYDHEGRLRFRDDVGTGVTSEYFYVAGELLAKRDTDTGSETTSAGSGGSSGSDQPNGPTGFNAQAYSGTAAQFNWTTASDNNHGGAPRYELYRNGSLVTTTGTSPGYWLDTGLTPATTYDFELVALYPDGTRSARVGPIHLNMVHGEVAP